VIFFIWPSPPPNRFFGNFPPQLGLYPLLLLCSISFLLLIFFQSLVRNVFPWHHTLLGFFFPRHNKPPYITKSSLLNIGPKYSEGFLLTLFSWWIPVYELLLVFSWGKKPMVFLEVFLYSFSSSNGFPYLSLFLSLIFSFSKSSIPIGNLFLRRPLIPPWYCSSSSCTGDGKTPTPVLLYFFYSFSFLRAPPNGLFSDPGTWLHERRTLFFMGIYPWFSFFFIYPNMFEQVFSLIPTLWNFFSTSHPSFPRVIQLHPLWHPRPNPKFPFPLRSCPHPEPPSPPRPTFLVFFSCGSSLKLLFFLWAPCLVFPLFSWKFLTRAFWKTLAPVLFPERTSLPDYSLSLIWSPLPNKFLSPFPMLYFQFSLPHSCFLPKIKCVLTKESSSLFSFFSQLQNDAVLPPSHSPYDLYLPSLL